MRVGQLHGKLVARILFWLMTFLEEHPLGSASTEVGVLLTRDPDLVYGPMSSSPPRSATANQTPRASSTAPPTSPVEVLSPEGRAGKMQEKIRD
jgi:hypothetical protein